MNVLNCCGISSFFIFVLLGANANYLFLQYKKNELYFLIYMFTFCFKNNVFSLLLFCCVIFKRGISKKNSSFLFKSINMSKIDFFEINPQSLKYN